MATIVMEFEIAGTLVSTKLGEVCVTRTEVEMMQKLKANNRLCCADLIDRFDVMTFHERSAAKLTLNSHVSNARKKLRTIGLDIVTIRGWGYRLGERAAVNARTVTDEPTHGEIAQLKDIEAGKRPVRPATGLSDFDRERIRNLAARGLSLTGIASMIRKPYAAIAAELAVL